MGHGSRQWCPRCARARRGPCGCGCCVARRGACALSGARRSCVLLGLFAPAATHAMSFCSAAATRATSVADGGLVVGDMSRTPPSHHCACQRGVRGVRRASAVLMRHHRVAGRSPQGAGRASRAVCRGTRGHKNRSARNVALCATAQEVTGCCYFSVLSRAARSLGARHAALKASVSSAPAGASPPLRASAAAPLQLCQTEWVVGALHLREGRGYAPLAPLPDTPSSRTMRGAAAAVGSYLARVSSDDIQLGKLHILRRSPRSQGRRWTRAVPAARMRPG